MSLKCNQGTFYLMPPGQNGVSNCRGSQDSNVLSKGMDARIGCLNKRESDVATFSLEVIAAQNIPTYFATACCED